MDKNMEREAYWRGHVEAWQASGKTQRAYCDQHGLKGHSLSYWHLRLAESEVSPGAESPLTLIPASMIPDASVSIACLSLNSPNGWRLEFAALPPASWLVALWAARS